MMMSVYRQGEPLQEIDHLELMKQTVSKDGTAMLMHARLHQAIVLIGLSSGEAIIKPVGEDDYAHRFETLYDTAITLSDWKRMTSQKVKSRDDLAPHLFEMELHLV